MAQGFELVDLGDYFSWPKGLFSKDDRYKLVKMTFFWFGRGMSDQFRGNGRLFGKGVC
jgi:hypothetical protein